MDLTPGTRIDRYVLLEPLGEGGQGTVWKAEDLLHPAVPRALKLVPLALSRPNDVERVRREARALARLTHPSLVASHALFEDLKLAVLGIAMDFVDGASLAKYAHDQELTRLHRVSVLRHVAQALAYVHQSGVVHRDLKLDNVLVTRSFWQEPEDPRNVKLVDFGIAKVEAGAQPLTQLDTIIGTLPYLAPEELDPAHFGESFPPAADVFAFGILGYRLLVGDHPTGLGKNATVVDFATAYRQAAASTLAWPPGIGVDPWSRLIADCLVLRARQRIPDGTELARRAGALGSTVLITHGAQHATVDLDPTALARPSAHVRETVDLAPLPSSPAEPATVLEAGARPPTLAPRQAAPAGSFPWLLASGSLLTLLAAGALAYYALVVRLRPEVPPPPLPGSVGSASEADLHSPPANLPDAAALANAPSFLPEGCEDAGSVCPCCASGHDCAGPCQEWIPATERWLLRAGALEADTTDAGPIANETQICTQLTQHPELEKCASLKELASSNAAPAALEVDALEIAQTGVEVTVLQKWISPVPIARTMLKRPIRRKELCSGLELTTLDEPGPLGVRRLVLYLDKIDDAGVSRCSVPTK